MKHDEETLLDDVVQIMKSEMPAKVTEINTEKADDITLASIPNDRYIETLNEDALNWSVFIYYGVSNLTSNGIGPTTSSDVEIFFDILFLDDQSSLGNKSRKAVQRYTRAMREVMHENFKKIKYASNLIVQTVSPVNLRDVEDSNFYKVAGITVKATIG